MTKKTVTPFSYFTFFKATFLFFVLLMVACAPDQATTTTDQINTAKAQLVSLAIDTPFEEISSPSEALVISNPAEASTFQLASGGYLKVPANAFQTASGEIVKEEVKLVYKNYQSVSEIITSGIPMKVANKDGTVDWMQTGGMFEIRGYIADEPVSLATDKPIEVSLISTTEGNFDVWEFDEAVGNWEGIAQNYQAQKEIIENEALAKEINQLRQATKNQPVNPDTKGQHKLLFNDLDLSQSPKLKGKSTIALVYIGKDKAKDPKSKSEINTPGAWYKKELKPLDATADTYTLTLYGEELYQIPVKVALQGAELEAAKVRYQALLTQHQEQVKLLKSKKRQRNLQNSFRRTIRANNMGIYNYDNRYFREATALMAEFDFGPTANHLKKETKVYLVTADNTVVVPFYGGSTQRMRYYPDVDNKLIAVLPGDLIATFSERDFKEAADELSEATLGRETYVFNMNLRNGKIESIADLQVIIDEISNGMEMEETQEAPIAKTPTTTSSPENTTNIRLYPNPIADLLTVDLTGLAGQRGQLSLNNQMGQQVKTLTIDNISAAPIELQTEELGSGTYYLTIIADGNFVATKKVMKVLR
ncbi:MAG: T9SS type A sorting domain-containing protein [Saprospiraceae bacterium]